MYCSPGWKQWHKFTRVYVLTVSLPSARSARLIGGRIHSVNTIEYLHLLWCVIRMLLLETAARLHSFVVGTHPLCREEIESAKGSAAGPVHSRISNTSPVFGLTLMLCGETTIATAGEIISRSTTLSHLNLS